MPNAALESGVYNCKYVGLLCWAVLTLLVGLDASKTVFLAAVDASPKTEAKPTACNNGGFSNA